jgi:hypothetical protein
MSHYGFVFTVRPANASQEVAAGFTMVHPQCNPAMALGVGIDLCSIFRDDALMAAIFLGGFDGRFKLGSVLLLSFQVWRSHTVSLPMA